jgi:hypothetical protein
LESCAPGRAPSSAEQELHRHQPIRCWWILAFSWPTMGGHPRHAETIWQKGARVTVCGAQTIEAMEKAAAGAFYDLVLSTSRCPTAMGTYRTAQALVPPVVLMTGGDPPTHRASVGRLAVIPVKPLVKRLMEVITQLAER